MECKNCSTILKKDFNYFSNCVAKVIYNNLTFKNLSCDFGLDWVFGLGSAFYVVLFTTGTITLEDLKPVRN